VSMCSTAELVAAARAAGCGVAAFNVITLEHVEAVVAGAEEVGLPVIMQVSENAVRFHAGQVEPLARAATAAAEQSSARLALHLDHVTDTALLRKAVAGGFSSMMFDAGAAPYEENVVATRRAAEWAHTHGLWLEAELGYVGGKPEAPVSAHADGVRTDPDEAAGFVEETGVDGLAVAVGSSHAMTERTASLDHRLIRRLATRLPVPLVLHGSSGVPDEELVRAVEAGMTKINVGTALNLAYSTAVRRRLAEDPRMSDPRKYLQDARKAMAARVAALAGLVGRPTAGGGSPDHG
jgi:fructose-bisphosphate aldolase, class II